MHKLDEILKHHGTKGMHWGVRHDNHGLGTTVSEAKVSSVKTKDKGKIRTHLDSLKRERDWRKVLKTADKMSTKDIQVATKRISAENSLKTLSKSKMATKKDKADYLRRHEMDDAELQRKINRLNAKEGLHKAVSNASKEQREIGLKVVQTVGTLSAKAAMGNKLNPKDFLDAYQEPTIKTKQDAWDNSVKIADKYNRNEKVKKALKLAKGVKVDNFVKTKSKS